MFKNALFTKTVCITTIYAFTFAILPNRAYARIGLAPISFSEMYSQAQSGEVESLRAAIHRGMDIDTVNSSGDTGLCLAAKRRDVYTYNAFRAAGANPRHPCTQNISGYNEFVERSDVIGINGTSRAAYAAMGDKETYKISPVWWWIGGAVVVGGVVALLLGGKHGGKHSSGGGGEVSEDYFSLGANIATKGKSLFTTSGTAENNKLQRHANENTEKIAEIDLLKKALSNTEYMDAILSAKNGGSYVNAAGVLLDTGVGTAAMNALKNSSITNSGYIKIDSYNASVGMVASENSTAVNKGKGINTKSSSNGINMNFSGYEDYAAIVGMYADTKSTIENHGDIHGTAIEAAKSSSEKNNGEDNETSGLTDGNLGGSSGSETKETALTTANTGALIGMEAMILNVGKDLSDDVITVLNGSDGDIRLAAGDSGASENEVKVELVGMGSFIDNAFLNGSHIISRAESVNLTNEGNINLSYTGNYTSSSSTALRKGLGGIIGMRSDANTKALNAGNIAIILYDEFQNEGVDVAAGMQSVHGGNITNSGNISISTPTENKRINYGMLAVEGSGANSSLYTNLKPNVLNSGNINVLLSNSFGMASFVGGKLHNDGNITIGSEETRFNNNIAMYGFGNTQKTDFKNTGTIDIYSHKSIAMQNDYAGGTDITNDGIINIHESALDSYVFGGSYSRIYNANTINYDATSSTQENPASNGDTYNPFSNYSISVATSIISTKPRSIKTDKVDFSSSSTEGIYNNKDAVINMNGSSFVAAMTVEKNDNSSSTQAKAYNYGLIDIKDRESSNATNSIGMYLDRYTLNNSGIFNYGTIRTNSLFSAAMASESVKNADILNAGTIETQKEYSLGIFASDYSNIINSGNILLGNNNSVAIQIGKSIAGNSDSQKNIYPNIKNTESGIINVGSQQNYVQNSFGIYADAASETSGMIAAQIENAGIINLYTQNAGAAIYSKSSGSKITNKKLINVYGNDASGIYNVGDSEIVNESGAIINVGTPQQATSNSYAIYSSSGGTITNRGTINFYNKDKGYAVYSVGHSEVINDGDINLYNPDSTAIYAEKGTITNKKDININNDNSTAFEISDLANATNEADAVINVGSEDKPVSNSNGIISSENATGTILNKGTINLYNDADGEGNSHAISAGNTTTVINDTSGVINSYNDESAAVLARQKATIKNNGLINVRGNNVYGILGSGKDNVLTAENTGTIIIGEENANNNVGYGITAKTINSIVNSGVITIYSNRGYGIYAEESISSEESETSESKGILITDTGVINGYGKDSVAIFGGAVASIINNGTVFMAEENSRAIETNTVDSNVGQTIKNNNDLVLENGNDSIGIYARGKTDIINSQKGKITVGNSSITATNGHGIYALDANSISNNAALYIYSASASGISGGQSITNTGYIRVTGNNSYGIFGAENNLSIDNNSLIVMDKAQGSSGIYSNGNANINNTGTSNVIIVGSEDTQASYANGIYAANASSINNEATINVFADHANGIYGGQEITNTGYIYVLGDSGNAIFGTADNTSIHNSNSLTVHKAQDCAGIYSNGVTSIINDGENKQIYVGCNCDTAETNGHGIYALNATSISNTQNINVYARLASGISGGVSISNSGDIYVVGDSSYGIFGGANNTLVDNSGSIRIDKALGSTGIYSEGTAVVTNNYSESETSASSARNKEIRIGSATDTTMTDAHGIYAINATNISSNTAINVYASSASGISGGQSITNLGDIYVAGNSSNGIFGAANNTTINNSGGITMADANASAGIYSKGSNQVTINNTNPVNTVKKIVLGSDEVNADQAYGIKVEDNGYIITNQMPLYIYASNGFGIFSQTRGNQTINNSGAITLTKANATGIYGYGNTSVTNEAPINISVAQNGYGIKIEGGTASSVDNARTGLITLGDAETQATGGYGIYVVNAGTISNMAPILVYAAESAGIYTQKAEKIENSEKIDLPQGNKSVGIRTEGEAEIINNSEAEINIGTDENTIAIDAHGIYAPNATSITNNADITVYGSGSTITGGDYITNTGALEVTQENSKGIYSKNAQNIQNSGNITLTADNATGIETHGTGSVTNEAAINIAVASGGYGILSKEGTSSITNESGGVITLGNKDNTATERKGYGIYVENAGQINNSAPITVYASESAAIYNDSTSSEIVNNAALTIAGASDSYGIYSGGEGTITNNKNGTIVIGKSEVDAANGHGIYAPNSSMVENNALITVYAGSSTAITGHSGIYNNNTLSLPQGSSNIGIAADGSGSEIISDGAINITGASGSYGIKTTGNSTIESKKPINIGVSGTAADTAYGIYSTQASEITNNDEINVHAANSTGIYGGNASKISNDGTINLTQNNAVGIDSEGTTEITNNAPINLSVAGNAYGIRSTGSSAQIENQSRGNITLGSNSSPSSSTAYGIKAINASAVSNYANISIYSSGSYGIYADNVPNITHNSGEILVSDMGSYGIYSVNGNSNISISGGTINLPVAANSYGVALANGQGSVSGNGNITIGSNGVSGSSGNYGIFVNQGDVDYSGNITLYGSGMGIDGNGNTSVKAKNITITGTGTAINRATTATIYEGGVISVENGDAIIADDTVTNNGSISVARGNGITTIGSVVNSRNSSINVNGAAVKNAASLENRGTIKGNTSSQAAIYNVGSVQNLTINSSITNDYGYGIYRSTPGSLSVINEGKITSANTAIYNTSGALSVTNTGTISVTGSGHGIYNRGATSVNNEGTITVAGNGNGINVIVPDATTSVSITNSGTIMTSHGYNIYIYKEYEFKPVFDADGNLVGYTPPSDQVQVPQDARIECSGSICTVPGTIPTQSSVSPQSVAINKAVNSTLVAANSVDVLKSVKIVNKGVIKTAGAIDFGSQNDDEAQISVGSGGSYEAESFSGTVRADASIVENGFETTYVNKDSFVGENNGIQVVSQSYMFEADTQENANGNTDVVMTKRPFAEVVENEQISEYLEKNYSEKKGENVFKTLKTASDQQQLGQYIQKELGFGMLPNLAKQSLDIEKTIAGNVNEDLLDINQEANRYVVDLMTYKNDVKNKGISSGYKDKVVAMYGFTDKAVTSSLRIGAGLQVVRSDSDFNDGSARYNNMAEVFAPIIFSKDNIALMVKPKLGFARGHYRRTAVYDTYKAKTKEYYYGADSSIKQNIDLSVFELEPEAGLNITALATDDIDESRNGLRIKDKTVTSTQSVLSLKAKRRFYINEKSGLTLATTAKYFHEFGKKYKNHATAADMTGYYDIISNRLKRDFGLISLQAQYDYEQLTLDASANLPLEEKRNPYYLLNVKYKF